MCYEHARGGLDSKALVNDIGCAMELMISRGVRTDGSVNDMEVINGIGLLQHRVSKVEELIESREHERSFLSRILAGANNIWLSCQTFTERHYGPENNTTISYSW